jgi:hypothetical protein
MADIIAANVHGLTSVAEFGTEIFRQAQNKLSKKIHSVCTKPAIEPSRCYTMLFYKKGFSKLIEKPYILSFYSEFYFQIK